MKIKIFKMRMNNTLKTTIKIVFSICQAKRLTNKKIRPLSILIIKKDN